MKDYYAVLGVKQDDSVEVIRAKYRKLAKQYHPDLNQDDKDAAEFFKEINEAWETLGDSDNRAKYDKARNKTTEPGKSRKRTAPVNKADLDNLMEQFDSFFGGATVQKPQTQAKNPLDAGDLFEKFMGFKK